MGLRHLGLLALSLAAGCFNPDSVDSETDASSGPASTGSGGPSTSASGTSPTATGTTTPGTGTSTTEPTTDSTTDPTTGPTTDADSSSGGVEVLECVEALLDPAVGSAIAEGNTQGSGNDFAGSCGGANSNDIAFQWIAPFTDYFVFDTLGSSFDTSLYLLDGDCDGAELGCSDNTDTLVSSRVVGLYEEGQQVVVVVDGETGAAGDAVLNVAPVSCPNADLQGQVFPTRLTNVGGTSVFSSSCGGDEGVERALRYTAEVDGLHSFRAISSDFTPIMNVQRGPECGGPDLQCNRTQPGAVGSEVIRYLDQGESVTLIVDSDSGTGDFDLDVQVLPETCPSGALDFTVEADLTDFPHAMTASCGNTGELQGAVVTLFEAATFSWTSPGMTGTNSGCEITYTGGFPAVISLQEGSTCSGAELQCEAANFDDMADRYSATVEVGHIPPTDFTVTVTQTAESLALVLGSDFRIDVGCFASG